MSRKGIKLPDDSGYQYQCAGSMTPHQYETWRMDKVYASNLLDSSQSDMQYDRITAIAARTFETPISAISIIDHNRFWLKSTYGIDAKETPREASVCHFTIMRSAPQVLVVSDALNCPEIEHYSTVIGFPFLRFYAGAPMYFQNVKIGTLCVMDTYPRFDFDERKQQVLINLAEMASSYITHTADSDIIIDKELARMDGSVIGGLHVPVKKVSEAFDQLYHMSRQYETNDSSEDAAIDAFTTSIEQLQLYVEASIQFSVALMDVIDFPSVAQSPSSAVRVCMSLQRVLDEVQQGSIVHQIIDSVRWDREIDVEPATVLEVKSSFHSAVTALMNYMATQLAEHYSAVDITMRFSEEAKPADADAGLSRGVLAVDLKFGLATSQELPLYTWSQLDALCALLAFQCDQGMLHSITPYVDETAFEVTYTIKFNSVPILNECEHKTTQKLVQK